MYFNEDNGKNVVKEGLKELFIQKIEIWYDNN